PPEDATVAALMESMREVGQLQPIVVQRHYNAQRPYLIAGRNRLEAAGQLGWDSIRAVDMFDPAAPGDQITPAMAEIAENLHRRELRALERANLQAQWAALSER